MSMDLLQVVAAIDANETVMADSYVVTSAYIHIAEREAHALTAERERRESAVRQREDIKRMLRAERERREEDVAEARREGFDAAANLIDFAAAQVRRTTQGRILAGLSSAVAHARDETLGALASLPDRGER